MPPCSDVMPLSDYARRGRRIVWFYVAWKAYQEWTDEELSFGDLYAGLAVSAATIALVVPDPVSTAIGWSATRAASPAVSTAARGLANFRTGLAFGATLELATLFRRTVWTAGMLHLVTAPWQIEDIQQEKERTGAINYFGGPDFPLEPGDNPMPVSLGIGGARIW